MKNVISASKILFAMKPCGSSSNAVIKRSVVSVFISQRCADSVSLYTSCLFQNINSS